MIEHFAAARAGDAAGIAAATGVRAKPKRLIDLTTQVLESERAHELLDARGSVVFEATASAAELIDAGVEEEDVYVETTSFDTIGNAFFARTDHCSLAGWKRLLIITSEFHMARSRAIFDWVFGTTPHEGFELTFLATPDESLTPDAVAARADLVAAVQVRARLLPVAQRLEGLVDLLELLRRLLARDLRRCGVDRSASAAGRRARGPERRRAARPCTCPGAT